MRTHQLSTFQSLRRAQHYLDDRTDGLGPLNQTPARATLDDVVTKLEAHALEQGTTTLQARGDTNLQRQLAAELRVQHMRPIAKFARANLRGVPEFAALTASGKDVQGEMLVDAALAMAAAAKPHEQAFVEAKFPTDFLTTLTATAEAVRASIDTRSQKTGRRSGATKGIAAELARGRTAVNTLDAVITKLLAGDAAGLAEWRSAKRITAKAGARRSVEPQVAAPAAPAVPAAKK